MVSLEELADLARRNPNDPDAWVRLAVGLQEADLPRRAAEAALEAARLNPTDERTWLEVGRVLQACGEDHRALAAFRRAASAPGSRDHGWQCLGELLLARGDRWAAQIAFGLAGHRNPQSVDAHLGMSRTFLVLEMPERALNAARLAYELAPSDPTVLDVFSRACEAAGHGEEAIAALRSILETGSERVDVLIRLARRLDEEGRSEEAYQLLEDHADPHRQDAVFLRWLGRTRRRAGHKGAALNPLRTAVRLQPEDAESHLELAAALRAVEEMEDAKACLLAAARLDPSRTEAWNALADVELALGHREDATRALLKAASLSPDDSGVRRRLSDLMGSEFGVDDNRGMGGLTSDLKVIGVPELLQLLHQREANGVLSITLEFSSIEFEFRNGLIVEVARSERTSSPPRTPQPAETAERPPPELPKDPEERIFETLKDIVGTRQGGAAFRPEARLPSVPGGKRAAVNPQFAVLEVMRRTDEESASELGILR